MPPPEPSPASGGGDCKDESTLFQMSISDIKIETDRLILRPPIADDFEPWAEFLSDEEAARFIGGKQFRSTSWRIFCTMVGAWHAFGFAMFSVIEKSSGRWIGRLGPWFPAEWPGTEIGWGLVRDAWGKGYALEGAIASTDWAFDNLGWAEVIHSIDPENQPSRALAQRLGSRILRRTNLPAPLNHMIVDIWGQTREEWRARPRNLS